MRLNRTLTTLVVLLSLLDQGTAFAQGVLEVEADQAVYGYGDVIRISVTVSNPTDEAFVRVGSSSCQAQFLFDSFDSYKHTACTADEFVLEFGPGSERTWSWELTPAIHGLPASDGAHTIVGYYPGTELADTIWVNAPEYLGGRLSVGIEPGISSNQLAPLRDSLNAEIVSSFETSRGLSETWEISGISLEQAVANYSGDVRFRHFEIKRMIQYAYDVSIDDLPKGDVETILGSPFPNPCSSECMVELQTPMSETVQVAVFDVLGRKVQVVQDGFLQRDSSHRFTINARMLATGSYIIHAIGDSFSASRILQVAK